MSYDNQRLDLQRGMLVTDEGGVPAIIHRMGDADAQLVFPTGELEVVKISDIQLPPASLVDIFTPTPVMLAILNSYDPALVSRTDTLSDISNVVYFNHQVVAAIRKALADNSSILNYDEMVSMIARLNAPECAGDLTWSPAIMPRHWHSILIEDGSIPAMRAILGGIALCSPITISMTHSERATDDGSEGSRGKMGPRASAPALWRHPLTSTYGKRSYDLTLDQSSSDDLWNNSDESVGHYAITPVLAHVGKKHKS